MADISSLSIFDIELADSFDKPGVRYLKSHREILKILLLSYTLNSRCSTLTQCDPVPGFSMQFVRRDWIMLNNTYFGMCYFYYNIT